MKRFNRRILISTMICTAVCLSATCLYLSRNLLLRYAVDQRIAKIEQRYRLKMSYQELSMQGLDEVNLKELTIVPINRDTLLHVTAMQLHLNFFKLLESKIEINRVNVSQLACTLIKRGNRSNYDFLFQKETQAAEAYQTSSTYANKVDRLLSIFYDLLPANGHLTDISLHERTNDHFVTVQIPHFNIVQNKFHSSITIQEDSCTQHWEAQGELNRSKYTLKTSLYSASAAPIALPYINRRFGAAITFDTLQYSLTKQNLPGSNIALQGEAKLSGLNLFHQALSPDTIHLNRGALSYHLTIDQNTLELDSTSTVLFNKLNFHPYLKAEKKKENWHLTASVTKSRFPADDLFSSLPKGLFANLEGLKTSGELAYHFYTDIDWACLDSLKFTSELTSKSFRIVQYGQSNLNKMSSEFMYTAYEQGNPVRTFPIGPSWEHFTPLDSISPILQMSVLQSEDGAFFYHQGFLPDAIREALIYDLKVKRFARGGSTITMQLVKNVFLNRHKNFARKLEEALIVWLIETAHLTPKARLYEVYLNIAEWGPLIYGIQEAATFYFNKRPSELNTEESIFLASIIPKPKHFQRSFTENGDLKANMEGYYRLIAKRLAKKGLIDETTADSIRPHITVSGEARKTLIRETPETLPVDENRVESKQ